MTVALFPGSFDPFHLGHLRIVEWAAGRWDEVVVAVLGNPEKAAGLFTIDERVRLAGLATAHLRGVRCMSFAGLTGALAKEQRADVIVRAGHKEADIERTLAVINKFMSEGVPTEFAPEDPETDAISATSVRDLLLGRDPTGAAALVPGPIRDELATAERIPFDPKARPPAAPGTGPMTIGRRVEPLRVVALQDTPVFLDRDASLDKALGLVAEAAEAGAQLVVLPEAFLAGYPEWVWRTVPGDAEAEELRGRLFDEAIVVNSAYTSTLGIAAKRHGTYLSIGVVEREPSGGALYSSQLLFTPEGALAATDRKVVARGPERLVWESPAAPEPMSVDTRFGRIGTAATVDVLVLPTWRGSPVWAATAQHLAHERGVWVVAAGQCPGTTLVVGPDGAVLTGPVAGESGSVTTEVDVNQARHLRRP